MLMNDVPVKGLETAHNPVGKYLHAERRTGDPSDVAGASILASLSSLRQDLSRWKSPTQPAGKTHSSVELDGPEGDSTPNLMGNDDKAPDCVPDGQPGTESGNVKISGMNHLLGPLLRMLGGPSCCKLKYSKGVFKQVAEEVNDWSRDSQPAASTSGMSVRCAVFKEDIHAKILDGKDIDVSFDNFPYYLR